MKLKDMVMNTVGNKLENLEGRLKEIKEEKEKENRILEESITEKKESIERYRYQTAEIDRIKGEVEEETERVIKELKDRGKYEDVIGKLEKTHPHLFKEDKIR